MSYQHEDLGFFRRLLRKFIAIIKIYLIGVGVFWTVIPLLALYLIYGSLRKAHDGSSAASENLHKMSPSILKLTFDGQISDRLGKERDDILSYLMSSEKTYFLLEITRKIQNAASDPLVEGMFVDFKELWGSKAQIVEIRNSFLDFKAKNKKIHCWAAGVDSDLFILASACDHLEISPAGSVELLGPYFSLTYFGEALKKLGVGIDVLRSGSFKNAFEPLVSNEPSAETLQMYQWLESDLRSTIIEESSKSAREGLTAAGIKEWFTKSLYTPGEAKTVGIVNNLNQKQESMDAFEKIIGKAELDWLDFEDYQILDKSWSLLNSSSKEIAYIHLAGEILYGDNDTGRDEITPDWVEEDIKWALEQDKVAAIVLRIDSPGGSALASEMIWGMVRNANAKKPVVVSIGSVGASGGYYIASAAKKILVDPFSITGSIGVIGMVPNFSQFPEKYGVSFHSVTSSNRKTIGDRGKPLSEDDRKLIVQGIDETYELFLNRVAEGRSITRNEVHEIAQGKVWTGKQAIGLKLADRLGGIRDAIQESKILAGLDPDKLVPIVSPNSDFDLAECLLNKDDIRGCFKKNSRSNLSLEFMNSNAFLPRSIRSLLGTRQLSEMSQLSTVLNSIASSKNEKSKLQARLYGVQLK